MRYNIYRHGTYENEVLGTTDEYRIRVGRPVTEKRARRLVAVCPVHCVAVTARFVNIRDDSGQRCRAKIVKFDNKKKPFRLWGKSLMAALAKRGIGVESDGD